MNLLYLLIGIAIGALISVLTSYAKQKGKNIATKEDIREITEIIETVRQENSEKIESLKSSLTHRLNLNSHRYEQEFKILKELTEKLVAVRDSARELRPAMDSYDPNEPENGRKNRRLSKYGNAARELYLVTENNQPFFPQDIYKLIKELDKVAWLEAIKFRRQNPSDPKTFETYWNEAEENSEKIANLSQNAIDAIRRRVVEWEEA